MRDVILLAPQFLVLNSYGETTEERFIFQPSGLIDHVSVEVCNGPSRYYGSLLPRNLIR